MIVVYYGVQKNLISLYAFIYLVPVIRHTGNYFGQAALLYCVFLHDEAL